MLANELIVMLLYLTLMCKSAHSQTFLYLQKQKLCVPVNKRKFKVFLYGPAHVNDPSMSSNIVCAIIEPSSCSTQIHSDANSPDHDNIQSFVVLSENLLQEN